MLPGRVYETMFVTFLRLLFSVYHQM